MSILPESKNVMQAEKRCDIWESLCKVCHDDCATCAKSSTQKGNLCLTMMLLYSHLKYLRWHHTVLRIVSHIKTANATQNACIVFDNDTLSIWRTVVNCLPDKNRRRIYYSSEYPWFAFLWINIENFWLYYLYSGIARFNLIGVRKEYLLQTGYRQK